METMIVRCETCLRPCNTREELTQHLILQHKHTPAKAKRYAKRTAAEAVADKRLAFQIDTPVLVALTRAEKLLNSIMSVIRADNRLSRWEIATAIGAPLRITEQALRELETNGQIQRVEAWALGDASAVRLAAG